MTGQYAAIVLAGGRGSRLGGVDKGALTIGRRSMLDRTLDAVRSAEEVVVVGPAASSSTIRCVREEPAFAGPAAAALTGDQALGDGPDLVAVLAVDMPDVTEVTIRRLLRAAEGHDGSVLIDQAGRRQLALVVDRHRLRTAAPAPVHWPGLAMWRLVSALDLVEVHAVASEAQDIDTPEDLAARRAEPDT